MKFTVFSLLLFASVATSLKIDCVYKNDYWPTTGEAYYCYATNVEVLSQNDVVEQIEGTHMSEKIVSDVNAFWIEKSPNLLFMPGGFENFYKHLTAICINDSGMKQLSQKDLKPFPNLEGIWFYGNKLTTLSDDTFQFNPLLRHLDFSRNRIRLITENVLAPITRAKVIRFHGNVCINKDVTNYEVDEIKEQIADGCARVDCLTPAVSQCDCEKLLHDNNVLIEMSKQILTELKSLRDAQNALSEIEQDLSKLSNKY